MIYVALYTSSYNVNRIRCSVRDNARDKFDLVNESSKQSFFEVKKEKCHPVYIFP